jgi:hippurate hydrolase
VNQGVMHACGHDGHTAMLQGAAHYLAATQHFDGLVNFIFQPAEEGLGGAKAMIEDDLFQRFACRAIFGMHNRPSLEVGRFAVRTGPMMAGGAFFDIRITGKGAHGARPETGVDAALAAAQIAVSLQSIVARNVAPVDTAVLSVTRIHSGDAYNVIPQGAELGGTVRAFSREVMQLVESSMRRVAENTAAAFGAPMCSGADSRHPPNRAVRRNERLERERPGHNRPSGSTVWAHNLGGVDVEAENRSRLTTVPRRCAG